MSALMERTVGQIVAENPARARVFEKYRIDYCCGGKLPLTDACGRRGVDAVAVVAELEQMEQSNAAFGGRDWNVAPLGELADHIVAAHHDFLRAELPRLFDLSAKVARVHGDHAPATVQIHTVFAGLRRELEEHTMKEEQVLFPWIKRVEDGGASGMPMSMANPIACMEHEHENAGAALDQLRALTNDYTPPMDACNSWRVLYASLAGLEADMHVHIHKENSILFPRALELERTGVDPGRVRRAHV